MTAVASAGYLGTLFDLWQGADSSEITEMMSSVVRWLASTDSTNRFRESRGVRAPSASPEWQGLVALGLTGLCVPEGEGGLGLSPAVGALAAETIGRHLMPEPYLACAFLPSIYLGGLPRSRLAQQLQAGIAAGAARPVVAVENQFPGGPVTEDRLTLQGAGGNLVLNGTRRFVYGADWATHFIVPLAAADAPVSLLVASAQPGLSVESFELCDGTYAAHLHFRSAAVTRDAIIASGEALAHAAERLLLWTKLGVAAELMGVQTALLGITIEYIRTRKQFGRELASFQALQHRAVDLYAHKEVARYLVAEALNDAHDHICAAELRSLALRCKARAATSGQRIAREAVQMHGAIGFSDECDVSLYLNRTLLLNAWGGGGDVNRRIVFDTGSER